MLEVHRLRAGPALRNTFPEKRDTPTPSPGLSASGPDSRPSQFPKARLPSIARSPDADRIFKRLCHTTACAMSPAGLTTRAPGLSNQNPATGQERAHQRQEEPDPGHGRVAIHLFTSEHSESASPGRKRQLHLAPRAQLAPGVSSEGPAPALLQLLACRFLPEAVFQHLCLNVCPPPPRSGPPGGGELRRGTPGWGGLY